MVDLSKFQTELEDSLKEAQVAKDTRREQSLDEATQLLRPYSDLLTAVQNALKGHGEVVLSAPVSENGEVETEYTIVAPGGQRQLVFTTAIRGGDVRIKGGDEEFARQFTPPKTQGIRLASIYTSGSVRIEPDRTEEAVEALAEWFKRWLF